MLEVLEVLSCAASCGNCTSAAHTSLSPLSHTHSHTHSHSLSYSPPNLSHSLPLSPLSLSSETRPTMQGEKGAGKGGRNGPPYWHVTAQLVLLMELAQAKDVDAPIVSEVVGVDKVAVAQVDRGHVRSLQEQVHVF